MFGLFGWNNDYGDDPYGGLITPRDRRDAIGAALGGFAAGTLGQGYSRMPRTPFQDIGAGLAQASKDYENALDSVWRRRLLLGREKRADERFGLEKGQLARQNRMTDAQIAELERKAERDRALEDAKRRLGEIMAGHIARGGDPSRLPPEGVSLILTTPLADEYLKSVLPKPPDPTNEIKDYQFAKQQGFQGTFMDFLRAKAQVAGDYSKSPLFAQGPNGELGVFQLGSRGEPKQIQFPPGWRPADQYKALDLGDRYAPFSTRTGMVGVPGQAPPAPQDQPMQPAAQGQPMPPVPAPANSPAPPPPAPAMQPMAPQAPAPDMLKKNLREAEREKHIGQEEGKREGQLPALRSKAQAVIDALDADHNMMIDEIGRALDMIEKNPALVTGGVGAVLSAAPYTPAYALRQKLETIMARAGFDKLQAMREASPTGGALGPVSDQEGRWLQSSQGSLAQAQTAHDLAYNLRRIRDGVITGREIRAAAFARDFGVGPESQFRKHDTQQKKRMRFNPQTGEIE
jgi:hypothetical protein